MCQRLSGSNTETSMALVHAYHMCLQPPPDVTPVIGSTEQISLGSGGGGGPLNVVVADLNNDGNMDIAVASYDTDSVQIVFGKGDGTFEASTVTVPVGHGPTTIIAHDVNGDGLMDLTVLSSGDGTVTILLQTSKGMKTRRELRQLSSFLPSNVSHGSGTTTRHLQASTTTTSSTGFSTVTLSLGPGVSPLGLSVADLDGDGVMDIVTSDPATGQLIVLKNDGQGGFGPAQTLLVVSTDIAAMATGDLNGDGFTGKIDIMTHSLPPHGRMALMVVFLSTHQPLLASSFFLNTDLVTCSAIQNTITVSLRRSDGTLQPAAGGTYATKGQQCVAITVTDVDGDGSQDVLVVNYGSNTISYFQGGASSGGGLHSAQVLPTSGYNPVKVSVMDMNFDGILDLVVANEGTESISFLYG